MGRGVVVVSGGCSGDGLTIPRTRVGPPLPESRSRGSVTKSVLSGFLEPGPFLPSIPPTRDFPHRVYLLDRAERSGVDSGVGFTPNPSLIPLGTSSGERDGG